MKIVYLETATLGLRWMKQYYREQSQLNSDRVFTNFEVALKRLRTEPFAGHPFDNFDDVRELVIAKSPFSILYTDQHETIYIIDIRDQRGLRSANALASFIKHLRSKHDL